MRRPYKMRSMATNDRRLAYGYVFSVLEVLHSDPVCMIPAIQFMVRQIYTTPLCPWHCMTQCLVSWPRQSIPQISGFRHLQGLWSNAAGYPAAPTSCFCATTTSRSKTDTNIKGHQLPKRHSARRSIVSPDTIVFADLARPSPPLGPHQTSGARDGRRSCLFASRTGPFSRDASCTAHN